MTRTLDQLDPKSVPSRATAIANLAIALVLAACAGATATPSPSPASEPSPTPQSSVPVATSTAIAASPSPAPWPVGRLVYGRFDSRGVTPFTSNTDGSDERQLLPPHVELPVWAPNGLQLSVVANSPQGLVFVGTVKPDGSDYVQFDSPEAGLDLGCNAWSPDGARLACEGFGETDPTLNGIYTVNSTDGADLTRVTTSPDGQHDLPGSYSLDGSQIIFGREDPEDLDHGTLMVVNLDGTDERPLTDEPLSAGTLSPDGTTILSGSEGTLYLVPFAGGQPIAILIKDAPGDIAFGSTWSPDGQWIVFTLHPRNAPHSDIYIMRRDGSDLRQVTHTPNQDEEFAGWAPAP